MTTPKELEQLRREDEVLVEGFEWSRQPAAPKQQRGAFTAGAVLVMLPPQPPDGYFMLADFLCVRVNLPLGTFTDYPGMRDALFGVKPGNRRTWHPSNPKKQVTPARSSGKKKTPDERKTR